MKIEIDTSRISTSCECIDSDIIKFDEELDNKVNQLKYKLLNNNKSCYLISGYRGTGKSTFIKKVESRIKKENDADKENNKNIIFVNINLSKYESYSVLLRKLTRGIYFSLIESGQYETIKSENEDLVNKVEDLYKHTFYEVYKHESVTKTKETSLSIASNVAHNTVKYKLLTASAAVTSLLNTLIVQLGKYAEAINILFLFVLVVLYFVIDYKHENKKLDKEEEGAKSLYDDEIAEYRFIELIKEFNKSSVGITFVIDELDKIEDDSELDRFISDLKPMMLSDLANFIIISGQKLYYKVNQSSSKDDSIYRSIFNNIIHIPFMSNVNLSNLFKSYFNGDKTLNKIEVDDYIYSLILESGRITREFKNLMLRDIRSENNKSYLYIEDSMNKVYRTDYDLSSVINKIANEDIYDSTYDEGVKDFLTAQLFIWVKKLKTKPKYKYFPRSDIFDFDRQYKDKNLDMYKNILENLYDRLEKDLKEVKMIESDINGIRLSFWLNLSPNKLKSYDNTRYIIGYINILKSIYLYLFNSDDDFKNVSFTIKEILYKLSEMSIVDFHYEDNKEIYLIDKVADKKELNADELKQIMSFKEDKPILVEKFTFYLIRKSLEGYHYEISTNKKFGEHTNGVESDMLVKLKSNNDIKYIIVEVTDFTTNISFNDDMLISQINRIERLKSYIGNSAIAILIIYMPEYSSLINSNIIDKIIRRHNIENINIIYIKINNSGNIGINSQYYEENYNINKFKQELLSIINSNVDEIVEVATDMESHENTDSNKED